MGKLSYSLEFYSDGGEHWWRLKHADDGIVCVSTKGFPTPEEARVNAKRVRDALHLVLYAEPAV